MLENAAVLDRPTVPAVPRHAPPTSGPAVAPAPVDPLGLDRAEDAPLLTTERRLQRLAIVAADAGARFARERSPHDPVAWMLAPRALFGGGRAIEACQDRAPFLRATLLHGLGLGVDADPDELDALLADDEDGSADDAMLEEPVGPDPRFVHGSPRLFCCTVQGRIGAGGRSLQAFCATVAADAVAVRRRLAVRYGEALAARAVVREGFDPGAPLVRDLLTASLVRRLEAAEADPAGADATGLDLRVEQRFVA